MHLFPYVSTIKETGRSFEQIRARLEKICVLPAKKMDIGTFVNHRVLEYNISSNRFMILMGRYGLSYGITNLAPALNGNFVAGEKGKNSIRFTIRPRPAGMITLILLYSVAFYGLIVSVSRDQIPGMVSSAAFIVISYSAILSKFNKEMKNYKEVIRQLTDQ